MTAERYNKHKSKFEKQKEDLEAQKATNQIEMSKLQGYIAFSLMCCSNVGKIWASGDYTQRQELQNARFDGGIVYDRLKDECRSTGGNEFVSEVARLSEDVEDLSGNSRKN